MNKEDNKDYFYEGVDYGKSKLFASAIHALAHYPYKLTITERFDFADGYNLVP